jgi:hypothetical protein
LPTSAATNIRGSLALVASSLAANCSRYPRLIAARSFAACCSETPGFSRAIG